MSPPGPNIGGDVSPLSHRDRRPCFIPFSNYLIEKLAALFFSMSYIFSAAQLTDNINVCVESERVNVINRSSH